MQLTRMDFDRAEFVKAVIRGKRKAFLSSK
jgi:hypothetical protein